MINFSSGDFRFFWPDTLDQLVRFPSAWDSSLNTGIGKDAIETLWINSYLSFTAFFTRMGFSWFEIGIVFWIVPSILLSFFSAFFLFKHLFNRTFFSIIAGLIYLFNTYFVLVILGGQTGVALAYSVAPFIFLFWFKLLQTSEVQIRLAMGLGLITAFQVLLDPRITYITLIGLGIIFVLFLFEKKKISINFFKNITISFVLVVLLHLYWIIPSILFQTVNLGNTQSGDLNFFSFAKFENSLTLLHPNWPENIFGKTYFQTPFFVIFPLLAFLSLLFIKKEDKSRLVIVTFAVIGILGIFLAKGTNDPFGFIYTFLFYNIPGFSFYRDPTKWYIFISLSYSILIPFSLWQFQKVLVKKNKTLQYFIPVLFVIFLLITLYRFTEVSNPLYELKNIPQEYLKLSTFIGSQKESFRTLWIPQWQRYGYFSDLHPAIGRYEILKTYNPSSQIKELTKDNTIELLRLYGVKYIIVPYDSEQEIFLKNRSYDSEQYEKTITSLENISSLTRISTFKNIGVFEVNNYNDRIWSSKKIVNNYKYISPSKYEITLINVKKGDMLYFSESYSKYWRIIINNKKNDYEIQSVNYNGINSFKLNLEGNYSVSLVYIPQMYVNMGVVFSGIVLIICLCVFVFKKNK